MADAKKKPAKKKKKPAKVPNFFWAPDDDGTLVKCRLPPPAAGNGKIDPKVIRAAVRKVIAERKKREQAGAAGA